MNSHNEVRASQDKAPVTLEQWSEIIPQGKKHTTSAVVVVYIFIGRILIVKGSNRGLR